MTRPHSLVFGVLLTVAFATSRDKHHHTMRDKLNSMRNLERQMEEAKSELLASINMQDVPCTWTAPSGEKFDLSDLADKELEATDPTYHYKMRICGISQADTRCVSAQGGLCQYDPSGFKHMLASWTIVPSPSWNLLIPGDASKGLNIAFSNGDSCYNQGRVQVRNVNIQLNCKPAGYGLGDKKGFSVFNSLLAPCVYNVIFNSEAACPGYVSKSKRGLSGGSVFLIIFFVSVPIYIAAGCFYKRRRMGAVGIEAVPCIDFWRDLPNLVKEGVAFTLLKLRCGKGQTRGGGYDGL